MTISMTTSMTYIPHPVVIFLPTRLEVVPSGRKLLSHENSFSIFAIEKFNYGWISLTQSVAYDHLTFIELDCNPIKKIQ